MSCLQYEALLDPFLDGELPPETVREVQCHLTTCDACRSYVETARIIRSAFPQAGDVPVPDGFADSVMEAVRAHPRKKRRRSWQKLLVPLAACFLLVLLGQGMRFLPKNAAELPEENVSVTLPGELPASNSRSIPSDGAPQQEPAPETAPGTTPETASEQDPSRSVPAPSRETVQPKQGPPVSPQILEESALFADLTLHQEEVGSLLDDFEPLQATETQRVYALDRAQYSAFREQLGAHTPELPEAEGDLARITVLIP